MISGQEIGPVCITCHFGSLNLDQCTTSPEWGRRVLSNPLLVVSQPAIAGSYQTVFIPISTHTTRDDFLIFVSYQRLDGTIPTGCAPRAIANATFFQVFPEAGCHTYPGMPLYTHSVPGQHFNDRSPTGRRHCCTPVSACTAPVNQVPSKCPSFWRNCTGIISQCH